MVDSQSRGPSAISQLYALLVKKCAECDRRVSTPNFTEVTCYFGAAEFIRETALQSDHSDDIPSIYKLGEKTAQQMLTRWR